MALQIVTAATNLPLSAAQVRDQLRIDGTADEQYLTALQQAAVEMAEIATRRALLTQTWDWFLDGWTQDEVLFVPKPPLQSVTSIKYYDTNGTQQTLSSSLYTVDTASEPARILPAYNESWPDHRDIPNAIEIRFVAGYANPATVPATIKTGIRLLLAHLYENREPAALGVSVASLPYPVQYWFNCAQAVAPQ